MLFTSQKKEKKGKEMQEHYATYVNSDSICTCNLDNSTCRSAPIPIAFGKKL